jgi:membrane protein YdbS with pleckstrin-like domain
METGPTNKLHDTAEAEERDVWWGAYAGRTMLPDFVLCGVLTAILVGIAWALRAWHGSTTIRYATQLCIAVLWIWQFGRWSYRMLAVNYRLTTRRLFCERGFHHPGSPGLELSEVVHVAVERGPLERLLRVGRIRVVTHGDPERQLVLEGVHDPEHIASEIRKHVSRRSHSAPS